MAFFAQPTSAPRLASRTRAAIVGLIFFLLPASAVRAQPPQPAAAATTTTTAPTRGVRAHDPSTIVKHNDDYWFFGTGPGVRAYRSRDLRHWEAGPRVFDDVPAWVRKFTKEDRLWAPDVIRAKDGRYLLYYSASSWGKNTSAIGLASNATLDPRAPNFRWRDEGIVVESKPTDDFNAIDPAIAFDADGKLWLSFGSFWTGIKLVQLNATTGKRVEPDGPVIALASKKEIEAPFIHRRPRREADGGRDAYYLFVNWGLCCRGVKSTYNIRVGRSDRIEGPYLDKDGKDLRDGGGTLFFGSTGDTTGPGHAGIVSDGKREWLSFHFYDAAQAGRATLGVRPLAWDKDGWPVIAEDKK